ncbi:MAG: hypothetical protein LBR29_05135 [Methylobacteriaceae bacterium]|jgi:hypothetical protein|nr:hypothetical protein [Methylobacteriaceae bacterium]
MASDDSEYTASRTKANYKDVFYQGAALIIIRLHDTFPFPDDIQEVSRSLDAYHLREAFQFTLEFLERAKIIRRFKQEVYREGSDMDLSRFDLMWSLGAQTYNELQLKVADLALGASGETTIQLLKKTLREKEVDVRRQMIKRQIDNIMRACTRVG